ncbi:pentatricopeptide repeat-containing protein At4g02750-like [Selaginella moellendorffii]|uniref:pentatricopeptide repeat-containing protein At4g02750-like n=1 Tax=Selaginella moellendorffii TaxID=88036 RepID=UPI000D1C684D|nr:pentatricopeptide repeat-containing protein At4g02750-like [Selaginella moellendorffii]|eukprot:XP_024515731.1 pentatricopeptide repeat-containing protein At4g02750-like [Selaginella moellendorffii]
MSTLSTVARTAQLLRNASSVSEVKRIADMAQSGDNAWSEESRTYLANLAVHMHAKLGSTEDAAQAFAGIRQPNVFSCNMMLAAYARNGQVEPARQMYEWMHERGVAPDVVSGSCLVRAAAQAGDVEQAKRLFDSLPAWDMVTWNVLLAAYGDCGHCSDAKRLFDTMPSRDIVSWTTLLHAFAQHGDLAAAQALFDAMPARNLVSWNTLLQAVVAATLDEDDCEERDRGGAALVAAQRLFDAMPAMDAVSSTALISAYGSVGDLASARAVFDAMPVLHRDVVAWNAIISAHARINDLPTARRLFDSMPHRDTASHNTMVMAYAATGHVEEAKNMFDTALLVNMVSWNSMLQTYATHLDLADVLSLFKRLPTRDVVSWTILVAAIARSGDMQWSQGVVFSAMPARALVSWNALLAGYAQAGRVERVNALFATLPEADVVTWSVAMAANANSPDHTGDSCRLLHTMACHGLQPNACSFLALLTAYSNLALLRPAWRLFLSMVADFRAPAAREHYCAMVALLARAGRLDQAEELMESMPFVPDASGWGALVWSYRAEARRGAGGAAKALLLGEEAEALALASQMLAPC